MQLLLTLVVYAVAIGLIITGIWYQIHRIRLDSDPVLIKTCFFSGTFLLLGNIMMAGVL